MLRFDHTPSSPHKPAHPLPGWHRPMLVGKALLTDGQPDEAKVRAAARKAAEAQQMVVIDDFWRDRAFDIRKHPEAEVEKTYDMLGQIVDWMHDERPSLRVGIYDLLPISDWWVPVRSAGLARNEGWYVERQAKIEQDHADWLRANARTRQARDASGRWECESLADKVDFVSPSLYTFEADPERWRVHAEAVIAEARKYDKQVYVWIWPQYHQAALGGIGRQMIPADDWRMQVRTCLELADGVIVYMPFNDPTQWDWKVDE